MRAMTTPCRSSESSAATGLRWRLGSLVPVQLDWLRELVVQLHLSLLENTRRRWEARHLRFHRRPPLPSSYLFKSIACNSLEGLLHVDCLLGTGFKIWDVVLALTPSLCSLGCYLKHKTTNLFLTYRTQNVTLAGLNCSQVGLLVCSQGRSCCQAPQRGNSPGLGGWPGSGTRLSSCLESWRCWVLSHRTPGRSSLLHGRTQPLKTGTSPDRLCPRSDTEWGGVWQEGCVQLTVTEFVFKKEIVQIGFISVWMLHTVVTP